MVLARIYREDCPLTKRNTVQRNCARLFREGSIQREAQTEHYDDIRCRYCRTGVLSALIALRRLRHFRRSSRQTLNRRFPNWFLHPRRFRHRLVMSLHLRDCCCPLDSRFPRWRQYFPCHYLGPCHLDFLCPSLRCFPCRCPGPCQLGDLVQPRDYRSAPLNLRRGALRYQRCKRRPGRHLSDLIERWTLAMTRRVCRPCQ
jgi:hypothetical protein